MGKLEIKNVHDSFFKKIFSDKNNIKSFLTIALPEDLLKNIELDKIDIDPTGYVSEDMKGSFSDMVVKTKIKGDKEGKGKDKKKGKKKGKEIPADIYLIFEHKSYRDKNIYFQLLKYMYMTWEQDYREGKELRVIIPLVFYHGRGKWRLKREFNSIFKVKDEIRKYLLNYEYLLFDTNEWDLEDEKNRGIRNNVMLMSGLLLMKSVFSEDYEGIKRVFDLWAKMGFKDKKLIITFLLYMTVTKDIEPVELKRLIKEKNIGGDEIMQTLGMRWYEEGRQEGIQEGIEKGIMKGIEKGKLEGKLEGELERARKVAKNMLMRGLNIKLISEVTGLSEKEVEKIKEGIRKIK